MTSTHSSQTSRWHFVIPFFYGVNRFVTGRGGAPVDRKVSFLTQTVASITNRFSNPDITIMVCDTVSAEKARLVTGQVVSILCPPQHLPFATVKFTAEKLCSNWPLDDIVVFNEDDQILTMSDSVQLDIERYGGSYFFTPHRWIQNGGGRRYRNAPKFVYNSKPGIIDNVYREQPGKKCELGCHYRIHTDRLAAYAACWATYGKTLQHIDFSGYTTDPTRICLETASFILLETGIPVVKPDITIESPAIFMVDHLSGYFYFKRRFSFKRLFNHLRKMKF